MHFIFCSRNMWKWCLILKCLCGCSCFAGGWNILASAYWGSFGSEIHSAGTDGSHHPETPRASPEKRISWLTKIGWVIPAARESFQGSVQLDDKPSPREPFTPEPGWDHRSVLCQSSSAWKAELLSYPISCNDLGALIMSDWGKPGWFMGWLNFSLCMGTQPSALEAAPLGDGDHHCQGWLLQEDDVVQAQGPICTSFVCWDKGQSSRISPKLGTSKL